MEISKSLQEEIILVQNKLKNAIRDHQICVGKLNAEPNNSELLSKIQEIQFHIVSLGRCQKQVVERLRKEVELYKADNANGGKVTLATLLGLNNNNHITTDNEKRDDEVKVQSNGIDVRISTRDNYDQFMRNGSILELPNLCAKDRCSSVETLSADEEIIELSNDEYLYEKRPETSEIEVPVLNKYKSDTKQINFLENLGLITANQLDDIQNKKTERKRRSTAKPQFVYSNWDMPTKRKRHSYLQSMGTAPQTRQTTARLNEPSPPPTKVPQKSTSPPTKTISKTLIPSQKSIARPNILRTMQESRAFQERSKLDNSTIERETRVAKSSETKAVHIPGLPSSLTIERIESDTAVCINCRNPGTLTICDTCSANYHISCHTVSSPSPRQCPKCIQQREDERSSSSTSVIKKDEDIAAASHASGVPGKTGENPESDKTTHGLHNIDATNQRSQQVSINQLPTSTLIIPITPSNIVCTTSNSQYINQQSQGQLPPLAITSNITYTPLGINTFTNQHHGITYIKSNVQTGGNYQQQQQQQLCDQQYLILQQLPTVPIERQQIAAKNSNKIIGDKSTKSDNSELAQSSPLLFDKLSRGTKKPIPDLTPIASITNDKEFSITKNDKSSTINKTDANGRNFRGESNTNNSIEAESSKTNNHYDTVFTSNNKSNIITNCNDKSSKNSGLSRETTVADRLARRLSEDRATAYYRSRQSTTKFTEHVKLEEAHLSAPLTTNLVEKIKLLDRPKSCPVDEIHRDCDKMKIFMRKEASLDSLETMDKRKYENFLSKNDYDRDDNGEERENSVHNDIELFDESTMSASEDEKTESQNDTLSIVSAIDMQVLEDFESAMRQIGGDDQKKTAE